MYRYMITNKLEKHHIHMQIEFKDESKWGSLGKDEYIQNHLLRLPDIVKRLKQIVVKDDIFYEIGNIFNLSLEAFNYLNNKSFNLDNDTKLMSSDSKNKA